MGLPLMLTITSSAGGDREQVVEYWDEEAVVLGDRSLSEDSISTKEAPVWSSSSAFPSLLRFLRRPAPELPLDGRRLTTGAVVWEGERKGSVSDAVEVLCESFSVSGRLVTDPLLEPNMSLLRVTADMVASSSSILSSSM